MPGGLFGKVRSQVVLTCTGQVNQCASSSLGGKSLNSVFRQLWSIESAVNCHHDLTSWLVGHVTLTLTSGGMIATYLTKKEDRKMSGRWISLLIAELGMVP